MKSKTKFNIMKKNVLKIEDFFKNQLSKNEKGNIIGSGPKDPQNEVDENGVVVNPGNGGGAGNGSGDNTETTDSIINP